MLLCTLVTTREQSIPSGESHKVDSVFLGPLYGGFMYIN